MHLAAELLELSASGLSGFDVSVDFRIVAVINLKCSLAVDCNDSTTRRGRQPRAATVAIFTLIWMNFDSHD